MPNPFKRFVYEFSYSFCAHKDIFVKAGYSYVKINDQKLKYKVVNVQLSQLESEIIYYNV